MQVKNLSANRYYYYYDIEDTGNFSLPIFPSQYLLLWYSIGHY